MQQHFGKRKRKIVLVGVAGVGKTTLGKLAAEKLRFLFADVDVGFEEKEGSNTETLLERYGDTEFDNRLLTYFAEQIKGDNTTIFAAPARILNRKKFWDVVKLNGVSIHLQGELLDVFMRQDIWVNGRKLTKEEKEGRFDIKYKTTSKKHVIIELKRAERSINSFDIGKQVSKYRNALKKILIAAGKGQEPIEIVCIVGKPPSDWIDPATEQESRDSLEKVHIRVVRYQELIEDSYSNYQAFLNKSDEVGRVYRLIRNIEEYQWGET